MESNYNMPSKMEYDTYQVLKSMHQDMLAIGTAIMDLQMMQILREAKCINDTDYAYDSADIVNKCRRAINYDRNSKNYKNDIHHSTQDPFRY